MQLTHEQFKELLRVLGTQAGQDSAILIFSGILAFAAILFINWFMIGLRVKPLEKLQETIEKMQETLNEISVKLWSRDRLENTIKNELHDGIKDHEKECPCRIQQIH